jgi:hypothetical protein
VTTAHDRRPLTGFLGAVGISALGTRMSFLAVPWFVLTATGSATLTGVVAFAEMAPYVTVRALGGPLVDRLGAWRVSVGTDILAAVFVGLVPALCAARLLPLPALALLVAAAGAARGVGDSARGVMVPGLRELSGLPSSAAARPRAPRTHTCLPWPRGSATCAATACWSRSPR